MKEICIIGPLPPPIGGDAKAIKTLIDSGKFKEKFNLRMINISDGTLRSTGKKNFTFRKLKQIIKVLSSVKKASKKNSIDTYYLTIAQSTFGSLRDVAILRSIFKYKKSNSKVIIHLHGGGFSKHFNDSPSMIKWLIMKYFSKVDKGIVLSKSLIYMFDGIIEKNRLAVIENCVDDQFLISEEEVNQKLESLTYKRPTNVIFLSNMIKTKGYLDLLKAIKLMKKDNKQFQFTFAGPFPNEKDKNEFEVFIKENKLSGIVKYIGPVDGKKKYELLVKGDIFVLPTYFPPEGQPISILESMGAGMPIITTNQGGIQDIVKSNINGFIIPAKNPKMIRECLLTLKNDVEKHRTIASQNRKEALNKYTEEKYIGQMLNILE